MRSFPIIAALFLVLVACQTTRGARLDRKQTQTFSPSGEFLLGAGDILEVKGYLPNEAPMVVTVGLDGRIDLPLVGGMKAAGQTTAELGRHVSDAFRPYMKSARFTVGVREMRSYRVYITGEVKQGGEYTFLGRTTLSQAVARAGGRTDFASGSVKVYRKNPQGTTFAEMTWDQLLNEEASGDPAYAERDDLIVVD